MVLVYPITDLWLWISRSSPNSFSQDSGARHWLPIDEGPTSPCICDMVRSETLVLNRNKNDLQIKIRGGSCGLGRYMCIRIYLLLHVHKWPLSPSLRGYRVSINGEDDRAVLHKIQM